MPIESGGILRKLTRYYSEIGMVSFETCEKEISTEKMKNIDGD